MRLLRIGLIGIALFLVIGPAQAAQKDVHVVTDPQNQQEPFKFSPGTQNVSGGGDTVQWINDTLAGHTATSDDGTSFDVTIAPSGTGTSPAFNGATRNIAYHCKIHPYMTGTVHVEAVIAPPPTTTTTAKPITNPTVKPTTTTRATTSTTATSTTETIALDTTTTSESTTSTTGGQVAINTEDGGGNGAAIAVLVLALAAVFGGGGYALYRMRRP